MNLQNLTEPVPIRGHHLRNIAIVTRFLKNDGNVDISDLLEYTNDPEHPYNRLKLELPVFITENLEKRFIIIQNEPDIICYVCPLYNKDNRDLKRVRDLQAVNFCCHPKIDGISKRSKNGGSWVEIYDFLNCDYQIAKAFHLEIGKVYNGARVAESFFKSCT